MYFIYRERYMYVYIYIHMYIYIYTYVYLHMYTTCTEEATEMAAKYMPNKKMCF